MVVCPKCGNNLQARKLFFLTNVNAVTCQVCSSRLRVKNREVNGAIGGIGGGLGGGIGALLLTVWLLTGDWAYFVYFMVLIALMGIVTWRISDKYIKMQLETSN